MSRTAMDRETKIEPDFSDEVVVYRLVPEVARALAQLLMDEGSRTHDDGWLDDAVKLSGAALEVDGASYR